MGENPQDGLGVGPCSRGDRANAASWSHTGSVSGDTLVSELYTTPLARNDRWVTALPVRY